MITRRKSIRAYELSKYKRDSCDGEAMLREELWGFCGVVRVARVKEETQQKHNQEEEQL